MSLPERTIRLMRLYRHACKTSESWMASRWHWFEETRNIRKRFEQHRSVGDPALIDKLLADGEAELFSKWHPDPIRPPYAHGSTLYGRNPPPPLNIMVMDFGREKGTF